jgi:hypothetical protein
MARRICFLIGLALVCGRVQADEAFVPGTGEAVLQVGDNFESENWGYVKNGRKASYEDDEQQRPPGGKSRNGRWYESALRGQPDVVKQVPTPPEGLAGSERALLLATKYSGIPGELAGKQMQDDLLMGVKSRLGRSVPVSWQPSFTVRVFLPPFEKWENRTGASFGIRADAQGRDPNGKVEPYWPGFFVLFRSETSRQHDQDHAQISFRAQRNGRDFSGPKIYESGWWTFGMSFTPDGQVHYYAHAGTDDLSEADHLYSSFPYGTRCVQLDNVFFNVANWENGKNWSTPWVIDDPELFVIPPRGSSLANLARNRNRSQMASRSGRSGGSSRSQYGRTSRR